MIVVDIYSVLIWLFAVITSSLGLVIFLGSKTPSSRAFLIMLFSYVFWMTGVGFLKSTTNVDIAEFFARFDYFMGGIIAAAFLYFCLLFPEDKKPNRWIAPALILLEIVFIPLYYYGLIICNATLISGIQRWGWHFGPLAFLFDLIFNGFFIAGLFILYFKYKKSQPGAAKTNLKFMFWSILIALIPAAVVNTTLPRFGYQALNWFGPMASLGFVVLISYSVMKYRQMSVKAVAAEVFVLVMAIVLFANIFIREATLGIMGRIFIFLSFISISYFFIKSILKEAEQKEQLKGLNTQLQDLNDHLEQKVAAQTQEVRQAYEVEKKARIELEELDKAKDQFILATQHHLRTPLTIIKGYLQQFLLKKAAPVDEEGRLFLEKASTATDRISALINELLDVSQMQVGKSILRREAVNLRTLVEDIFDEISSEVTKKHLKLSLVFSPKKEDNIVSADKEKVKEALTNLVDNAVKYNQEGGEIKVKGEKFSHPIEKDRKFYRLTIADTGIGIPPEELPRLLTQYFQRGKEAQKIYTTGRGIGLAVTKNIIQAHQGRIYAESDGRGRGAKFIVELPV
ncbi:MAG: hypothetical protein AUJ39_01430 [Parcubacteria group bacterium CG1_02_42_13]|nr:MAG: hypothetical protein AUJ39_01430 [Parcubacteria group bacterium CG1_02_42_13]